jgi:hypothetical protein
MQHAVSKFLISDLLSQNFAKGLEVTTIGISIKYHQYTDLMLKSDILVICRFFHVHLQVVTGLTYGHEFLNSKEKALDFIKKIFINFVTI